MTTPNADQADYWSSPDGQKWVTYQGDLDRLMEPALEAVLDAAAPRVGEHVLDIGCGTGASTMELARRVGETGLVTALDISEPLLDLARDRATAPNVRFVRADAQTHSFEAPADLVFSRFGVMFFDDPVAAFANLRAATRPGGRLAMICWQGMPQNPWFQLPFEAAVARLGRPSALPPNAPGPTAFKDVERVTGILSDAGWSNPAGRTIDVALVPPQDPQEAAAFATTLGPASRTLSEKGGSDADAAAIAHDIAEALGDYHTPDGLRIPSGLVIYTGVNPG